MRPPQSWTFAKFAVLSALRDGNRRTHDCLRTVLNWPRRGDSSFSGLLARCEGNGLIQRNAALVRTQSGHANEVVYEITPAGQQLWVEIADWFAFMLDVEGNPSDVLAITAAPFRGKKRRERLPTPAEEREIRRFVTPATLLAWDVTKAMPPQMTMQELFSLDVGHVDLQRSTIRVRGRVQPIDPAFRAVLARAIGTRESGPAVIGHYGRRLNVHQFYQTWRHAREKAGVDSGVLIRPRATGRGKRRIRRAI